jgi:hypothetical protein
MPVSEKNPAATSRPSARSTSESLKKLKNGMSSRSRGYGNQGFQGSAVICLALLMLLDAQRDLGLPLFQFARLLS